MKRSLPGTCAICGWRVMPDAVSDHFRCIGKLLSTGWRLDLEAVIAQNEKLQQEIKDLDNQLERARDRIVDLELGLDELS